MSAALSLDGAFTAPEAEVGSLWGDALLAAALLAVDPPGLKAALVRGGPGPARDAWLDALMAPAPDGTPFVKIPAGADDDRLFGGLDLAASLEARRPVRTTGLLAGAHGGAAVFMGAERLEPGRAARIAQTLDDGACEGAPARFLAVFCDEGEGDERAADALRDRAAFLIDLNAVSWREAAARLVPPEDVRAAWGRLQAVTVGEDVVEALTEAAVAFGVFSLRASLFALAAARAHAALRGAGQVGPEDLAVAVRLILAPRATRAPAMEEPEEDDAPPPPVEEDQAEADDAPEDASSEEVRELADQVLEAALMSLPQGLLDAALARTQKARKGEAGRKGGSVKAPERGRKVGAKAGDPRRHGRLDLIETLKAAAPYQRLRGGTASRLQVRKSDLRVARRKRPEAVTTIFVVDASGSSALNRMGEAKGAVELLLADCYARRDEAALVAFRGVKADVLLPPTRSLTRAKRALAALPGGGGTPLAAGLDAARTLANAARAKGRTPKIVLLTDGGANVTRAGVGGRAQAQVDALDAASMIQADCHQAIVIDTSPRPNPQVRDAAAAMGAVHLPMPRADARAIAAVAQSETGP